MSNEGITTAFSGEEALALHMHQLELDKFYGLLAAAEDRVKDDAEASEHLRLLNGMACAVSNEWANVIHARLVRVFPHLADVLTYLVYSEAMPFPDWINQRGQPLAWTNVARMPEVS